MQSRVKVLGHPVHQMLIPIPAGLFIVGAILDVVQQFGDTTWIPTVTYWNIMIGIGTALLAAIFGTADWTQIPKGTRAKRIGAVHGIGNVLAVVVFGIAIAMRRDNLNHEVGSVALTLEVIGFLMLGVTAWLGGELVDRLGVGVDERAHLDAPSSLRAKHVPQTRV
jgi:uncharacterized membrane protein